MKKSESHQRYRNHEKQKFWSWRTQWLDVKNSESLNSGLNQAEQKNQRAWTEVIWNYSVRTKKKL